MWCASDAILSMIERYALFRILRRSAGFLAYGSIITLDAQKNAVCAICIFYTLQYSMVLRRFNNILRYYILFCCFCNR